MKSLVLVSCLVLSVAAFPGYPPHSSYGAGYSGPPAPLAHDGRVVDTPEVARVKAAHLATHAAEAAKSSSGGYSGDYSDDYSSSYSAQSQPQPQPAYHGPPAPLAHDGQVRDTPEVAQAKAAHFAAHADQISKVAHLSYAKPYPQPQW